MKGGAQTAIAIGVGYMLGRRRKMRLATMLALGAATGGAAADPKFSEGGVGRDYLMRHGVPERSLIAETQGRDTSESAKRVAVKVSTWKMRMREFCTPSGLTLHFPPPWGGLQREA